MAIKQIDNLIDHDINSVIIKNVNIMNLGVYI